MSTSKKTKNFYLYLGIIILCLIGFFIYQQARTKRAVLDFFKIYHIQEKDISYQNVSHSFLGNNLIFYKVTFPVLSIDHRIEKIIISKVGKDLNIKVIGADVNIINSLRRLYNIKILEELATYNPATDIFQKPLQTMALANIDSAKFNLTMRASQQKKQMLFNGHLSLSQIADIDFSVLLTPKKTAEGVLYFLNGKIKPLQASIKDAGFFARYDQYLESIDIHKDVQLRQLLKMDLIEYTGETPIEINLLPVQKNKNTSLKIEGID